MSFFSTVKEIVVRLEQAFEKNADQAVKDPDEGQQADHDSKEVGKDTIDKARDGARDEAKKHDPAWKAVKDLSDTVHGTAVKAETTAKYTLLKFAAAVTAVFAGSMVYMSTRMPGVSSETKAAHDVIRQAEDTKRQIAYLDTVLLSPDDWNIMMGGLEVPSAPTPVPSSSAPAAVAAPLPQTIAAAAAEPVTVEVTTHNGEQEVKREFTTTVEQVYRQSPAPVRRLMEQPPPPKIDHGYDHPDPNDCFHRHCLGGDISRAGGFHRDFTVNAVDGNGNTFGSAHIHN